VWFRALIPKPGDKVLIAALLRTIERGHLVPAHPVYVCSLPGEIPGGFQLAAPAGATPSAPAQQLDIVVRTVPDPPKTGENQFEVVVKDAGGSPRGVTVDLGNELAQRLGVPIEFMVAPNTGVLTDALSPTPRRSAPPAAR